MGVKGEQGEKGEQGARGELGMLGRKGENVRLFTRHAGIKCSLSYSRAHQACKEEKVKWDHLDYQEWKGLQDQKELQVMKDLKEIKEQQVLLVFHVEE